MNIPKILDTEGLTDYSERLSEVYSKKYDKETRKLNGEIFTPKKVSKYMATLFEIPKKTIRLLDTGAGTGILTAAFCEELLNKNKIFNLTIDTYENDLNLLPYLKEVLRLCKQKLEERGHSVTCNIHENDFILENVGYFKKSNLMKWNKEHILYDYVISNPPYYKLSKSSPQSRSMEELIFGQPNIYALFMALSASMVNNRGEMVFITPRSFCSGSYYKKFREWFLNNTQITNIHIFESRKEVFDKDKVLQESVIIKAKKFGKSHKSEKVKITVSRNKDFKNLKKIEVHSDDVIYHKNGDRFIRIPTSPLDIGILHIVDKWPDTIKDLGLEISTGPVVPFRAEDYLLPELTRTLESIPLLWMHNTKNMKITWPLKKNKKASALKICKKTKPLILPVKNYVLIKRFSSKEQKRRLDSAVLLKSEFPYKTVGIENHLNYIHKLRGELSIYEAFGLSAILNTTFIDNFFRSLNGNTQVNATDIRSLPFPDIEDIRKIGKIVYESKSYGNGFDLDNIVAGTLGINNEIIKNLNKGETKYG